MFVHSDDQHCAVLKVFLRQTTFQRGLTRLFGKGDSTFILFQVQQSCGQVQMDMSPNRSQRKKMHIFLERQQRRIQS